MTPLDPVNPHLILHHYPASPFAEKIRAVMGFKQLAWKSVVIPAVMPKPDVVALTGGYRKTPILQVGADIYCDTALICDVLEHVQPEPVLYPPHLKGVARVFAQWADTTLFWAAMAYNLQPRGAEAMFASLPPGTGQAFSEDRREMSAGMQRLRPQDATAAYRSYLRRIAHMVEEHEFLFGAEPCLADFAAYHALWFTRTCVPVMADIFAATPAVPEWMDRIAALGHGRMEKFSAADAITVAAGAEPVTSVKLSVSSASLVQSMSSGRSSSAVPWIRSSAPGSSGASSLSGSSVNSPGAPSPSSSERDSSSGFLVNSSAT